VTLGKDDEWPNRPCPLKIQRIGEPAPMWLPRNEDRDITGRFRPASQGALKGKKGTLARAVRYLTGDGMELVLMLLGIARGEINSLELHQTELGDWYLREVPASLKERHAAIHELLERGWGRAPEHITVKHEDDEQNSRVIDFGTLTKEAQATVERLINEAAAVHEAAEGEVVEVVNADEGRGHPALTANMGKTET
jgi:hypothetical protein